MNSLPVIWQVGSCQPAAGDLLAALNATEKGLGCVMKQIHAFQHTDSGVTACSFAEFDDQWQSLLMSAMPDVIYVHGLVSRELVVCCAKWLRHIKAQLPSIKVILRLDAAFAEQTQTTAACFVSELSASADLVVTKKDHLAQWLDNLEGSSDKAIQRALQPMFSLSKAPWLLLDELPGVGFISQHQALNFSLCAEASFLTPIDQNIRLLSLVCFLAHGYDELDAITMAQSYLASHLDESASWPNNTHYLPVISTIETPCLEDKCASLSFAAIDLEKFGLYPVVDSIEWLQLVLENGATTAQLRIKDPHELTLDSQIKEAVALGQRYQAQVFINDYWQKAIEHGAFGIHLGQEDLAVADLEAIAQAGLALGISTHGYFEIANAMKINPSYIALGHIFPTQTKDMPSQPQGLVRLALYAALLKGRYPTVAIGGISAQRVAPVHKAGVDSVALVTAITKAANPEQATRELLSLYQTEKALVHE
ncbi:thiamine phosphate synthase [Marinomonas pollencensis]|uniref:Thiamine-phosphate synthase n=1 Tax=Marinomonas pollencensis TaxID=491954 RepID=A0A3E0DGI2_9GAMM|nr:thiamine phosphate synthase [Marinomonas pollencensis]REG81797.1 hydroxymethylpyrimidine kinase/phosphomethylpyrimidine kinase/thiamine-phosphate diphosphorylase [Marinomonas pollencensis]